MPKKAEKTTRRTKTSGSKLSPKADKASAEEKIKEAARILFTQKGFAATRTRDIADAAGINLALLNYYFRSKQKLFDIIMMENFRHFIKGISFSFLAETIPLDQRLSKVVNMYIDFLSENPDLPLFILNELRNNPDQLATSIESEIGPSRAIFFGQLQQAAANGLIGIEPVHLMANLVGLTVFPFVARPILQRVAAVDDTRFNELMQQRKELIPLWLKSMLRPQPSPGLHQSGPQQTEPNPGQPDDQPNTQQTEPNPGQPDAHQTQANLGPNQPGGQPDAHQTQPNLSPNQPGDQPGHPNPGSQPDTQQTQTQPKPNPPK
ncbi:MAG: TetR family transcriptional regulator [Bacteroidetes bacterium]|nr:TetR family transcriptional regulator [Bacteroidota bacterium]